eukprot:2196145-Pleurochrysis_carterae.AAC.1
MFLVIIHSGNIRLRSPTPRATHARTQEAARRSQPSAALRACTPPAFGRHAQSQASQLTRIQLVAPPRCDLDPFDAIHYLR